MQNNINVGSYLVGGRQVPKNVDPESLSAGKAVELQSACKHADVSKELECRDSFDQIDNGLLLDNEIPSFSTDQRVPCLDVESFDNNDRKLDSDLKNELTVGVQLDLNYSEISVFGNHLLVDLNENTESKIYNCFDVSNSDVKFQCNDNNIGSIIPKQLSTDFDYKLDFSANNCVSQSEIEYLNEDMSSLEEILVGDGFNENKESCNRNDVKHGLNEKAVIDEIIDDLIDNHLSKDSESLVPVKQEIEETINPSSTKIGHTDNETYNDEPPDSTCSLTTGDHLSNCDSAFFTHLNSKVDYANELQDAIRDNIINEHIDHFRRLEALSTAMHNSRQLLDVSPSVIPVSKFPSSAQSISLPLPTQQNSVFFATEKRESENVSYLEADISRRLLCHEILEDSANQDELVSNDSVDLNDQGFQSSDKDIVSEALVNNLPELSSNLFFNLSTENESKDSVQCHESIEVWDECQDEIDNIEFGSCANDFGLESNTGKTAMSNDVHLLVLPINQSLPNSDLCDCNDSVNFEKVTESSYIAKCLIDKLLDSITDGIAEVESNRMVEQKIDEVGSYNSSTENETDFNFMTTIDLGATKLETQADKNTFFLSFPEKNEPENVALETLPEVIDKESISANEVQLFTAIEDHILPHHKSYVKNDCSTEKIVDGKANYSPKSESAFIKCYAVEATHAGSHVGVSMNYDSTNSSCCAGNLESNEKLKIENTKAGQDRHEDCIIGMDHEIVVKENICQHESTSISVENNEKISIITLISNDVLLATDQNQNHSLLIETAVKISDLKHAEYETSTGLESVNSNIDISRSLPCTDSAEEDYEDEDRSGSDKNDLLEETSDYGDNETQDSLRIHDNIKSNLENFDNSDVVQPSHSGKEAASNSWLSKSLKNRTVTFNFDINSSVDNNCCVNSSSRFSSYNSPIKNQKCLPEEQLTIESGENLIENQDCLPKKQLTTESGDMSMKNQDCLPEEQLITESVDMSIKNQDCLPEEQLTTESVDMFMKNQDCLPEEQLITESGDMSMKNQDCLPEEQLTRESGHLSITNQDFFLDEQMTIESGESFIKKDYDIVKLKVNLEDKEEDNVDQEDSGKADRASNGGSYLESRSRELDKERFTLESQMVKCSEKDLYESDNISDCEVKPKIDSLASALEPHGAENVNMKKRKHTSDDVDKNCLEIKKNRYVPLSDFAEVPDLSQCDAVSHDEDESMYKEDESFITKTPLWEHKPWQDEVELRSPKPISTLSAFEEGVEISADIISKFKQFVEKESNQSSQTLKILEPCKKPLRIGLSRKYKGPPLHKYQ